MNWNIARFLAAVLSFCLTGIAWAAPTPVDVFNTPGIPGTGSTFTLAGPCYCDQQVVFSEILVLPPGTYDLGTVREYWTPADPTPDGGPDQGTLFLMFQPFEFTGSLTYGFPGQPSYLWPDFQLCDQSDTACNARYTGAYEDFRLVFTLTAESDAVQIGMVGNSLYTAPVPVPEAPASAMLLAGLALLLPAAAVARRRVR